MRRRPAQVFERFRQEGPERIGISSISVAELRFGMEKGRRVQGNLAALDEFLYPLSTYDFGEYEADSYGRLSAGLEQRGTPIGPLDTLIAAHALSLGATLVTNNTRKFERVSELLVENWADAYTGDDRRNLLASTPRFASRYGRS